MLCGQHMASAMRRGKCSALPLCMEGRSRDKGVLMGASAIDKLNYTDINASTIDGWVENGQNGVKTGRVCFDSFGRESGPIVRPANQLPGMMPPEECRNEAAGGAPA